MLRLHLLNTLAWVALFARPPLEAKRVVDAAGRLLLALPNAGRAIEAANRLEPYGTCLSRALAIAACLPSAEVVIGVRPGVHAPVNAHAWIELGGSPLRPEDVVGTPIARF